MTRGSGSSRIPRRRWVLVCSLIVWISAGASATRAAEEPGYLTLAFGRMQWVTANNRCIPFSNAVPLGTVADAMTARGLEGTGIVIIDRILESQRMCFNNHILQASWADLASFRDERGWTFVSGGTHAYMPDLSAEEKVVESCGSLPTLEAHGHDRAWGLFAFANDRYDDASQDVVNDCFAFGRIYETLRSNVLSDMGPPWFQVTHSLNGGRCNVRSLPCYTMATSFNTRYEVPARFATFLAPSAGRWNVLQAYRFVRGARLSGGPQWDCRATDPRRHWTNKAELYCFNDYLRILNLISSGTVVTDPAAVAEAIGRTP
jgi:hypothetical protein